MARKTTPAVLPAGKLPAVLLERLLRKYTGGGKRVVVGPSIGIDSAVIEFKESYLLAKTDPITFVAEDIGYYAIEINANDIAVMGGLPKWFLATILLPEGLSTPRSVEEIFSGLSRACKNLGADFCGGHTEVTHGIDRPIVVGQMLGEVPKGRLITGGGAVAGDDIILTKGIAIEAVSVIARTMDKKLKGAFTGAFLKKCRDFIKKPGLSVLKDAQIALKYGEIHSMHDPTEGGLSTGLFEVATASKCGILIDREIPVLPETRILCEYFGLDPMGVIASGALIMTLAPKETGRVIKGLEKSGIPAFRIGRVTLRGEGLRVAGKKGTAKLKLFKRDELTKLF